MGLDLEDEDGDLLVGLGEQPLVPDGGLRQMLGLGLEDEDVAVL